LGRNITCSKHQKDCNQYGSYPFSSVHLSLHFLQ
jgi:hypothetical protein